MLAGYLFDEISLGAALLTAGVLRTLNAVAYALLFGPMAGLVDAPNRAATAQMEASAPP